MCWDVEMESERVTLDLFLRVCVEEVGMHLEVGLT